MAIKTSAHYLERLSKMRPNVFFDGKLISRDDPVLDPPKRSICLTFDAAADPKYKNLVLTQSHLSGEPINRFTHVHQSIEDLLNKQRMVRVLTGVIGGCIQRCMANDTLNAIGVVSKEVDDARGTEYHRRFLKFLQHYQENDLVGNAAQSDVKGDRSKRPHEQADPDLYLHIVEKKKDGIVVRGAKAHNSIAPYADELLVLPTRALTKEAADWAVCFAIPGDTEGVKQICRITNSRPRIKLQAPYNTEFGICDSLTVFDNVFVPWDRVFLCGEWEFAGRLALLFANYHRHSYCGCKPATTDILMGAIALVAEYNGIEKAPHVRDALADLIAQAELVHAAGIASSVEGQRTSSGIYEPAALYSNAGRYLAGTNFYHEYELLASIAGGLPATLSHEQDWLNPETAPYLKKYIMRNPKVSPEQQHKLFRFISDFSCSGVAGVMLYAGVHGGGSPVMEKIGLRSQYDLESRKRLVKYLAGITD